jgi:hypothetical protein
LAYIKTPWVDGSTAITASRLNNLEKQYDEAVNYFGETGYSVVSNATTIPASVGTLIPYHGNNFNAGVFTVPKAGQYLFDATVYLSCPASYGISLDIFKNDTYLYTIDKFTNTGNSVGDYVLKGNIILQLALGDTVKFYAYSGGGSSFNNFHSLCSVKKLS